MHFCFEILSAWSQKCLRFADNGSVIRFNGGCWQTVIPYISNLFPNCMASSVKKMNICLVITLLMFWVLVKKKRNPNPKSSASLFLHDGDSAGLPHFSISLALVVFSLPFSFLLFPLATSSPLSLPPHALPGHSSRRVHFERINTVPIKGQRAARRSTRRHHSLSRTLLRYGRKSLAYLQSWGSKCVGLATVNFSVFSVHLAIVLVAKTGYHKIHEGQHAVAIKTSSLMAQKRTWNQKFLLPLTEPSLFGLTVITQIVPGKLYVKGPLL